MPTTLEQHLKTVESAKTDKQICLAAGGAIMLLPEDAADKINNLLPSSQEEQVEPGFYNKLKDACISEIRKAIGLDN